MNKLSKKDLIGYVEEIASKTRIGEIIGDRENKLGKSQFRTMAELAKKAGCYEELELLVKYKTAKGNGWDLTIKGDKRFGDVVLHYMKKIKDDSGDEKVMENLGYFFGYLHWKATALLPEKKSGDRRDGR